ncbi:hypothetical protein B0H13DRAFT_825534 [Mycena leptocephala]|nr:hypothetical protein B0H13DRAFT_825534 [Mycena leptocephala]
MEWIGQVTSDSIRACIALGTFPLAIKFLEQGLATTFQQMLQLKPRLDLLPPQLAKQFENLSSSLYQTGSDDVMRIVRERDDLIHTIRAQPGLDRFLLPKEYTELCQAAQNGPIVVLNANKMHCDALVILNPTSDPLHIPLPEVNLSHLENQQSILKDVLQRCNSRTRDSQSSRLFGSREGYTLKPVRECFDEILTGLWTHVVKPIFHVLESRGVTDGRLWWCPVGAFVGLPLHAAAPSDQFIPSYTSSLATLWSPIPRSR